MTKAAKHFFFSLLALSLLPAVFNPANSQNAKKLDKEIRKLIEYEAELKMELIPACVIGIIAEDSTYILQYGSGLDEFAVDENSIFEIGGLTKVFTAALVELLAEEEVLHLDSSLNYYLPPAYQNKNPGAPTLNQLLIHTSGLPLLPAEFGLHELENNNPYAHYTKPQLLEFYKSFTFGADRDNYYHYSHVNYALLEVAMEQATQTSFPQLLEEKILLPLNLKHTFTGYKDSLPITPGFTKGGLSTKPWIFKSFRASEGMRSTVSDLLKFAAQNMWGEESHLSPLLRKIQVRAVPTGYNKNIYAAKGWHIMEKKKYYDLVVHTGHTSGSRAFLGMVSETGTAVVILSNSEYSTGSLGYLILRMLNRYWKKDKKKR